MVRLLYVNVNMVQTLFGDTGLKLVLVIGGMPYNQNVANLRKKKPDLVVGVSCCCCVLYFYLLLLQLHN